MIFLGLTIHHVHLLTIWHLYNDDHFDDDDDDEVFVLGSLHDEMMDDLLQGGCYKWLVKLVVSCSSYITGRWHYLVIAGYWEYININNMKYLIAE